MSAPALCPTHGIEHQPRERPAGCTLCARPTWHPHRRCREHEEAPS